MWRLLTSIVDDFEKLLGLTLCEDVLRDRVGNRHELQFVGLSDYLSPLSSLHSTFGQVAGLVIEQAV
jgi:hypothetical protein